MSDITSNKDKKSIMPIGEHFEELRRMVINCLVVVLLFSLISFLFKEILFKIILAPTRPDFVTFDILRRLLSVFGSTLSVDDTPRMIATGISSQFMAHITMSFYFGLLLSSPYILYKLLGYVMPALYDNEKQYASRLSLTVYVLFVAGLLISYFIMFPVSCKFLTSYSISNQVTTMIDVNSYLDLFISLSLLMAAVFQLPVVIWFLSKTGIVNSDMLRSHRKHCVIGIMILAGVITPPDALSMIMVSLPLYLLFEVSIRVSAKVNNYKISNSTSAS